MPNKCPRCTKTVYFAEEQRGAGKVYHKACFKCAECSKKLEAGSEQVRDDEIYCKACYGKKFGPKGYGFGSGSGALSSTGKLVTDTPTEN